jgi:hypothetical protein
MAILCPDKPVMMTEERRICKSDRRISKITNHPVRWQENRFNKKLSEPNGAATKPKPF